jgi:glucosamine 6-phosphate synthetase-like amidotransferase/phosphosugar isomerase protein
MCGIAGYSLSPSSGLDRTLAAQTLLAAMIVKQRTPASELLDRLSVPADATQLLVHVRDYTKGHPSIAANNHPVRHGPVIGVHNGIIVNDDELLVTHSCSRAEPRMTVDSEAIFALAAHSRNDVRALEALAGSMAAAWLDAREPESVFAARGVGRPLWLGEGTSGVFFASTAGALELVEHYCSLKLHKRELSEGSLVILRGGKVARRQRFKTRVFVEQDVLPAVRAPQEREFCLNRLASIAAAA